MFVFLIFPVLISSILLPKKWTALFAICNCIGMILVPLPFSISIVINVIIGPFLLFSTISLFSVITAYYRESMEKRKRIELMNKNKELETLNDELNSTKRKLKTLNLHLEELVNQRTRKIEQLVEQKNEFIHMLSHDLKNSLGIILNLLPVAERRVKDKDVKKLIQVPYKQAKNMKELVSETVTLASMDENVGNTSFENIHLFDHIEKILEDNHELFQHHNIQINNQIDPDVVVSIDKTCLHELMMNLLTNAVKYTPEEKKGLIHIQATEKSDECVVSVSDNGLGISMKELENIFDKFYRIGTPRNGLDSTGLGLSICKHIVNRYNGRIWAESKGQGKGSTFYFTLPKGTNYP
jgi:signal transduction histidine kinase